MTTLDREPQPWVRHPLSDCHAQTTLRLIGGKWTTMVLYELGQRPRRYGEIKTALSGISAQVLTACLRDLERDGLISRTVYAEVPPRTEYRLTPVGESLGPVISALCEWGRRYEERGS